MSMQTKMLASATKAMQNAYAPYSHLQVGACLRTIDDLLFTGCNIENAAFPLSICAETAAISQLVCHGHAQIKEIIIISSGNILCSPCGGCRQRLLEFGSEKTIVHIYNSNTEHKTYRLGELLPHPFTANNLRSL